VYDGFDHEIEVRRRRARRQQAVADARGQLRARCAVTLVGDGLRKGHIESA
jgi:hypothetical protein